MIATTKSGLRGRDRASRRRNRGLDADTCPQDGPQFERGRLESCLAARRIDDRPLVLMTTRIKLHGSKASRFEAVKTELSDQMGYELNNPDVLGLLMTGSDPGH